MQLEWANQLCKRTLGTAIILAPLAVAEQTKREGEEFGIAVNICGTGIRKYFDEEGKQ